MLQHSESTIDDAVDHGIARCPFFECLTTSAAELSPRGIDASTAVTGSVAYLEHRGHLFF
jgi:hypothetical protein